jgi:hypothetical protein
MNSLNLRLPSRRTGYIAAALMLVMTFISSAFASAAQVTERSIELSSSAKTATNVTYNLTFTPVSAAGATALQFCSNSPLIGASCTAPTGINVASAAESSATSVSKPSVAAGMGPVVVIEKSITASATTLTVTGITNPSSAGPLYVRVITYDTKAHAEADYTATGDSGDNDGIGGTGAAAADAVDNGSVALSITDTIGVSAAVLETLLFCVSGQTNESTATNPIAAGCASGLTPPTLTLGETTGNVKALSASAISTGDIYTQISTNAANGAVVNLKSNVACGGLKRVEATGCDIAPAGTTGFTTAPNALFGVKVNADSGTDTTQSATGTFQVASGANYDGTTYKLKYLANNSAGVTSVYGDPILDTNGTQPSNRNMKLTFGASINNNTPAGLYKADLSLIATGKF